MNIHKHTHTECRYARDRRANIHAIINQFTYSGKE